MRHEKFLICCQRARSQGLFRVSKVPVKQCFYVANSKFVVDFWQFPPRHVVYVRVHLHAFAEWGLMYRFVDFPFQRHLEQYAYGSHAGLYSFWRVCFYSCATLDCQVSLCLICKLNVESMPEMLSALLTARKSGFVWMAANVDRAVYLARLDSTNLMTVTLRWTSTWCVQCARRLFVAADSI